MLKTRYKILIACLLLLTVSLSAVIFVMQAKPFVASGYELEFDGELKEYYYTGESINLPKASIKDNNTAVLSEDVYLRYPDGVIRSGFSHTLTKAGVYKATYVADGGKMRAEKSFSVYNRAYTFESEKSGVTFEEDLITRADAASGLKITLAEGDSFTCNEVLDLSSCTNKTPLIRLYPYTDSLRYAESVNAPSVIKQALCYTVKLTDYYNKDNFIEIYAKFDIANATTGRYHVYVQAKSGTQSTCGLQPGTLKGSGRRFITFDGEAYTAYYDLNDYGTAAEAIDKKYNGGSLSINTADDIGWSFYYDNFTKRIYFSNKVKKIPVTDLDDPMLYDGNLFEGFTTGEAILSVSCSRYVLDSATFEVDEIYGKKGKDLFYDAVKDSVSPEIVLSNNTNNFKIAVGEPFSVFYAVAKDINYSGDVNVRVFYEYNTENQISVPVVNGKFTPSYQGNYTIIYSAEDAFLNRTEKFVNCYADSSVNNLVSIAVDKAEDFPAGETVTLPAYTVTSLNNNVYCKIYAVSENGTKTDIDDSLQFVPRTVGKYTIYYEYGDEVSSYLYSYQVNALPSDNARTDGLVLPLYLIKNAYYTFDPVAVETYGKSKTEKLEVYHNVDGNGYTNTPIDYENYFVTAEKTVRFRYVYGGKQIAESDVITVCDTGFGESLRMKDYFVGDIQTSSTRNNVSIVLNDTTGSHTVDFINVISLSQFYIRFAIPQDKNNFSKLAFTLKDYYNHDAVITAEADTLLITDICEIIYDAAKGLFTFNGQPVPVNGKVSGDKVYLSISFINVDGAAGIDVYKLCEQTLSSRSTESVSGYINMDISLMGIYDFGEVLTVSPVDVTDVLSPFVISGFSFSVSCGDVYATTVDGKVMNNLSCYQSYSFKLTEYGIYTLSYSYTDQSGNYVQATGVIYVYDRISPEITLDNGYDEYTLVTVKNGKEFSVQGYTVSDNLTDAENIEVKIVAFGPSGKVVKAENGKLTLTVNGRWTIVYNAFDKQGNLACVYYYVDVI